MINIGIQSKVIYRNKLAKNDATLKCPIDFLSVAYMWYKYEGGDRTHTSVLIDVASQAC